jgi:hypothetical protein
MKRTASLVLFMLVAAIAFAQAPQAINYQGIARDGLGILFSTSCWDYSSPFTRDPLP